MLISNPLKKFKKMNMSKSGKVHISFTFLLIIFFGTF
jgi:hypothetical protein